MVGVLSLLCIVGVKRMMIRNFSVTIIILFVAGCADSPSAAHQKIMSHEAVVESFEALKASYSKRKQAQMDADLSGQAKTSGKSKEEIAAASLKLFKHFARCKNLKLLSEVVAGDKAVLTYENSDTCFSEEPNVNREIVHMVNESGWKIDEIEIEP